MILSLFRWLYAWLFRIDHERGYEPFEPAPPPPNPTRPDPSLPEPGWVRSPFTR